ncbi:hypothetical protein K503DRAFT_461662 [Rhizopogon vinicolor AM-OR11-026]|uniref:DUF6533 domain-containing protein n=1 Tax=Rhizopogon vinicolor AM-OR11-026 TaxID=1314800 RepID=A0A1B7MNP9_9AGAM|nr:hypothetical protein K503DRAFT_461662 [Rhizopogon vinicolor AM-OR11-026]
MNHRSVIDSEQSEKYLRVVSISIALYDFIITLPAEWRFYRSQPSIFHLSLACILFALIRYFSILVMVVSNYGFFSTNFTEETCQHYYLVAPTFKVVQMMISQVILGVRTFNIARRDRRVGIALAALFFVSISLEWFTNMFDRIPVVVDGNCSPGNTGKALSASFYYATAMLYDLIMLAISTVYLLRYNPLSDRLGRLVRVLIYEGIGYFIMLTSANVFNLILYRTTNVQNQAAGASLGYAVTWIMSQRILIHRRELAAPESRPLDNVVLARPAHSTSTRNVMSTLRSQFDSKSRIDADVAPISPRNTHNNNVELGIHVCVERSVVVDYMNGDEHTSSWEKQTI